MALPTFDVGPVVCGWLARGGGARAASTLRPRTVAMTQAKPLPCSTASRAVCSNCSGVAPSAMAASSEGWLGLVCIRPPRRQATHASPAAVGLSARGCGAGSLRDPSACSDVSGVDALGLVSGVWGRARGAFRSDCSWLCSGDAFAYAFALRSDASSALVHRACADLRALSCLSLKRETSSSHRCWWYPVSRNSKNSRRTVTTAAFSSRLCARTRR